MHVCWYVSQYYRLHNELKGLRLRRGIVLISFGVLKDPVFVNSKNNVYIKRIYRAVTKALIGGGGGVHIHIFAFCPTNFF